VPSMAPANVPDAPTEPLRNMWIFQSMLWMMELDRASSNFLRKRRRKGGAVERDGFGWRSTASAENRRPEDAKSRGRSPFTFLALCIYIAAFLTGAIRDEFEMLGSRYLGPYFGSGIYTWAGFDINGVGRVYVSAISSADRSPTAIRRLACLAQQWQSGQSIYCCCPAFADQVLQFFVWHIDDIKLGSIVSALAIMCCRRSHCSECIRRSPFAAVALGAQFRRRLRDRLRRLYGRQHPRQLWERHSSSSL